MNNGNHGKVYRIFSSLSFKLWGLPAMGALVTLLIVGYLFVSATARFCCSWLYHYSWWRLRDRNLGDEPVCAATIAGTARCTSMLARDNSPTASPFVLVTSLNCSPRNSTQWLKASSAASSNWRLLPEEFDRSKMPRCASRNDGAAGSGPRITSLDLDNVLDRLATETRARCKRRMLDLSAGLRSGKLHVRGAFSTNARPESRI